MCVCGRREKGGVVTASYGGVRNQLEDLTRNLEVAERNLVLSRSQGEANQSQ